MTKKELEAKVKELEARIIALEARPVYVPIFHQIPTPLEPPYYYPYTPPIVTAVCQN